MGRKTIFVMRMALSLVLAFLIGHLFFPGISPLRVLVLAAVLFGFAFVFEYTRKRDKGDKAVKQ